VSLRHKTPEKGTIDPSNLRTGLLPRGYICSSPLRNITERPRKARKDEKKERVEKEAKRIKSLYRIALWEGRPFSNFVHRGCADDARGCTARYNRAHRIHDVRTLPQNRRHFLAVSEERYAQRIPDGSFIRTIGSNNEKNRYFVRKYCFMKAGRKLMSHILRDSIVEPTSGN